MPKLQCPVEGHQDFTIEFPDIWQVRHYEAYVQGMAEARSDGLFDDESPVNTARFYGCRAACQIFNAPPAGPLEDWPLAVFLWFMQAVYYGPQGLDTALNPPKN
jgi:hypothetical protein